MFGEAEMIVFASLVCRRRAVARGGLLVVAAVRTADLSPIAVTGAVRGARRLRTKEAPGRTAFEAGGPR